MWLRGALALAADLERVGKARRRDQPGGGAAPLDQGIGEQCGGVDDTGDTARIDLGLAEQRRHARRDGARRIVVRGEDLAAPRPRAVVIVDHHVGEGPADVDAERVPRHAATPSACARASGAWARSYGRLAQRSRYRPYDWAR